MFYRFTFKYISILLAILCLQFKVLKRGMLFHAWLILRSLILSPINSAVCIGLWFVEQRFGLCKKYYLCLLPIHTFSDILFELLLLDRINIVWRKPKTILKVLVNNWINESVDATNTRNSNSSLKVVHVVARVENTYFSISTDFMVTTIIGRFKSGYQIQMIKVETLLNATNHV